MWRITIFSVILVSQECAWAAIVCREVATGRVLETQSVGTPGICVKNWVTDNPQYGFTPADIEEVTVSEPERVAFLDAWERNPVNPSFIARQRAVASRQEAERRAQQHLNLTPAQFRDIREAFTP